MSEEENGWERKEVFYREREVKNEIWFVPQLFKEIATWWIEVYVEIYRALNLDRFNLSRCCREFVDGKNASIDWEVVKDLLANQRAKENFIDGSRSCQEAIKTNSRNLDGWSMC